jgi:hypothetical protein
MPQAMKAHLVLAILDALMDIPESGLSHHGQTGSRRRGNQRKASHANPSQ